MDADTAIKLVLLSYVGGLWVLVAVKIWRLVKGPSEAPHK